jgi:uncharacterized protein (DUF1697 family)
MKTSGPGVFVALLRGINVGGNNIVSMAALKASFEELGFDDVATYINSGNVLFRSKTTDPRALEQKIDTMLARDYGLKPKTVVRSLADMESLVKRLEKAWKPHPEWKCNVMFLRHTLDGEQLVADAAVKRDIERVVCCPGTLIWSARIRDMPRTAMMKVATSRHCQDMTIRNVNTTMKVLALMQQMAGRAL